MTLTWAVALDRLERQLQSVEAGLAAGGAEVAFDALPAAGREALGPVPVELRDRAGRLHERMVRIEQAMAEALLQGRRSLALAGGGPDVAPRFLDARG